MSVILQNAPVDEPVYQFLDKKRAEGKPYYVYMTAGANKFLKRYYAKVVEHLNVLWKTETDSAQSNTDLGGIAAFICIPALLAQAVKDAAGAASPFILDWLGQLCYQPKPRFYDGLFVVFITNYFYLQYFFKNFSSSFDLRLDFLFVG